MENVAKSFGDKVNIEVEDAGKEVASLPAPEPIEDVHLFTIPEQNNIIRRIDRRLVVTIGVLYCVSLLDRNNMSAASIAGMKTELVLTGLRYNTANLVFFIPYILFQAPATIILRKVGPRLYLGSIVVAWGGVMVAMGFVQDHNQLIAMRTLLGLFEAGFFPSCVYLLSTWYTRYEVGKRYSVFYLLGCLASGFSGILAYGLMQMNGRQNLSGWRWIFIVEGALTIGLGIMGYLLIVDFPDSRRKTWRFLNQEECDWIIDRIRHDRGDVDIPTFKIGRFLLSGLDWKVWAYALIFFNTAAITYALSYTLPILLIDNMGFSIAQAQCLVAPPYVFAGLVMYGTAWVGDKFHLRGPIIIFNMILCLIGLPILGWANSAPIRYLGVFFVTAGGNSNIPAAMAFQANNIRGQWKRAFCSATLVGFLFSIVLVLLCDLDFYWLNRQAEKRGKVLERHEENASAEFRYTY
ncbi:unnamed protein product [Clonostachys solani]|uniref:Major facilitator superfamily (MFS) profile domain-containing protein n=1 Tax=Clonostachys solani TaxID=160281 RepID=A0A9N9ZI27_9HYPO|nr:unnamed protein product [Clonostachys solani]